MPYFNLLNRNITQGVINRKAAKKLLSKVTQPHDIWHSQQYNTNEFKPIIYQSVYGKDFGDKYHSTLTTNPEIVDKDNNMRRTQISEYSNALHNRGVFINPRFLSC